MKRVSARRLDRVTGASHDLKRRRKRCVAPVCGSRQAQVFWRLDMWKTPAVTTLLMTVLSMSAVAQDARTVIEDASKAMGARPA